ncbi:Uncharacterized membrane protein, DUF2068 family [Methylobacillus rhizosphaerae]|uniref:Uncharacterized membrane protein, DUF2068 family n=1 Tax=Methylobacillus rhizosphaerae TaxID=551994 RepID=A0A238XRI7_9PROT|nr:DUF2127 domain-containing protein [Methylobacillus rhizosphaerae]SNR61656.1 Uncharacterized membrane protein, DUF2068 family [Methylobacillus rhizosphaerae]
MTTSLRSIALFEASKGLVVLAASLALFRHINADWQSCAETVVRHLHLNPANHYPRILLHWMSNVTEPRLMALAFGALFYAGIRLLEAYGLWLGRHWAIILGMASAGLYLPFEILELLAHFSWLGLGIFVSNLVIVAILWQHHR